MKHQYQSTDPLLSKFVRTILTLEASPEPAATGLPAVTNGMAALIIKTKKDKEGNEQLIQMTLFGKSVPEETWAMDQSTIIIACFFKPFALSTLFNIAANKIGKTAIDLHNWNAHKTNAIKTQLFYANSIQQKIDVLNNLLVQQLKENNDLCETIQYVTDKILFNPDTELSEIQKQLNLNERTFQRIFKKHVGVTAAQYKQICRFQLSFDQLRSKQFNILTDIAYDNGFSDQSHFIRTFKEFTQTTPNNYLKSGLKPPKE